MPSSVTTICNQALSRIGSKAILDIEDESEEARECKLNYASSRDAILRSARWNFATRRETLSELVPPPKFGWAKRFQLPVDCLRILQLNGWEEWQQPARWESEGKELLTDDDVANIKYTARIEDPNLYDALFIDAFACHLASKIAKKITGSSTIAAEQLQMLKGMLAPEARRIDAQEGRRKQRVLPWQTSDLVRARGLPVNPHAWGDFVE
jgi:hypothetical protein